MTDTKPNTELAYKTLDQINAHPELHRQTWWLTELECGTAGCFAGWASMLSGDKPRVDEADEEGEFGTVLTPDGKLEHVEERAAQLLGIDENTASQLFFATNTRADLGRMVGVFFGPRPDGAA